MLVEKLVEKHAEMALSGVDAAIKKAALTRLLKKVAAANCPGGKLRSKGKGRGMGYGKGKGPVGVPVGEKEPAAMALSKTSQVKIPIVDLSAVREFVKRSSDKPKAARLFARLVKATTILNSKG
jgi:hypothetical protein